MALSNIDLFGIAKQYKLKLNDVLMKDHLTDDSPDYGNFIINLQSSTQGNGTHWVCAIVHPEGNIYFDSFGCLPPTELIDFLKRSKYRGGYGYNTMDIQDLNSDFCGFFCLAVIHYVQKHPKQPVATSVNDFTNLFNDNTRKNDAILQTYFRKYMGSNRVVREKLLV